MIDNSILGKRLNEFKNKKESTPDMGNALFGFFTGIISLAVITTKTLVFGYSAKIIFNTPWSFWQVVCVGLGITIFLAYIHDLIHDK